MTPYYQDDLVTIYHARICVTGPLGRWCGRSVGYGPAKWTGRIADLSASVFTAICGPLSRGLCRVTLAWS